MRKIRSRKGCNLANFIVPSAVRWADIHLPQCGQGKVSAPSRRINGELQDLQLSVSTMGSNRSSKEPSVSHPDIVSHSPKGCQRQLSSRASFQSGLDLEFPLVAEPVHCLFHPVLIVHLRIVAQFAFGFLDGKIQIQPQKFNSRVG